LQLPRPSGQADAPFSPVVAGFSPRLFRRVECAVKKGACALHQAVLTNGICLTPFVAREQVSLQISRHKTGGPMTQTRRMTMKLASTTERASFIWRKKG